MAEATPRPELEKLGLGSFLLPFLDGANVATEVIPGKLWFGAHPVNGVPDYFHTVLNLNPWGNGYRMHHETRMLALPMHDANVDERHLSLVAEALDWMRTFHRLGPMYVHCRVGLNRSGFVVVRWLMDQEKMTAREAIQLLRERRHPAVLSNEEFNTYLRSLDPPYEPPEEWTR